MFDKSVSTRIAKGAGRSRNPERTQERILNAAFAEFARKGFAGARVDAIAHQAGINKRMLYHYFGNKSALFREVLRRKMAQRKAWGDATPDDPADSLPYWFDLAIRDVDWIRLLEWEALQFVEKRLIDEDRRREAVAGAVNRIRVRQKTGHVTAKFNPKQILLAMTALTWFPVAFPQLTRLITGQAVSGSVFQSAHKQFLRQFASAFQATKKGKAHVLITVAVGLLLSGCSGSSNNDAKQSSGGTAAVPVVTARAETKDVPIELRNIGNVEAYATVNIRSQITGQITKIHFLEGQEVKKGDLLFTIDPRPAKGALRQAEADLKRDQAQLVSAKLEFERTKKLLESSIASRDDYDKAEAVFHALEATVMSDEASISRAQLQVEFTELRSPIDGRTGALMVREGNIVKAPDDLLVSINQVHPIYVTFSVPEQDLPAVRRRMGETKLTLEVQAASEPGLTNAAAPKSRGELSFVDNGVDPATGRIKMKATFPNEDNALWPGQFVQSTLILDTLKQAVVVPTPAVQSSQSGDFVFAVKPGNTVEKRSIETGFAWLGSTVIEKGVQSGETIVTDGQLRLIDGAHVTFTSEPVQSGTNAVTAAAP